MRPTESFMRPDFQPDTQNVLTLPAIDSWPQAKHRFEPDSILAVRAALAAERPLLVRGQPGVGKSQLARAVARTLNLPFLYHVVNSRTEHSDLLFHYDAVSRLAQAQVAGAAGPGWRENLAEEKFVRPGVLWWAFDWSGARRQAKRACRVEACRNEAGQSSGEVACCRTCGEPAHPADGADGWQPGRGCVVLIDEIDKADTDLPNGLLESFGNNGFQVPQARDPVCRRDGHVAPLVVITTNEERELPAAFLRRCVVLNVRMPQGDELIAFLVRRGHDHCDEWITDDAVYRKAAELLVRDRQDAIANHHPVKPGPAEYLDLLYAVGRLYPRDTEKQHAALDELRQFVFCKEGEK